MVQELVDKTIDKVKASVGSPDMLTRGEVQDQLSSITRQIDTGYGVKGGANKRTALEDAYAYWLAANQDRVKMKDFADFLQLDADAAQNAYLPEGGFGYRDVVDFDEIDFEGIAGPPPRGYTGDTDYESIQDDNFDALFDRVDAAKTADPFVAYVPPEEPYTCLLYTSPSPRDRQKSRMPSSA